MQINPQDCFEERSRFWYSSIGVTCHIRQAGRSGVLRLIYAFRRASKIKGRVAKIDFEILRLSDAAACRIHCRSHKLPSINAKTIAALASIVPSIVTSLFAIKRPCSEQTRIPAQMPNAAATTTSRTSASSSPKRHRQPTSSRSTRTG